MGRLDCESQQEIILVLVVLVMQLVAGICGGTGIAHGGDVVLAVKDLCLCFEAGTEMMLLI